MAKPSQKKPATRTVLIGDGRNLGVITIDRSGVRQVSWHPNVLRRSCSPTLVDAQGQHLLCGGRCEQRGHSCQRVVFGSLEEGIVLRCRCVPRSIVRTRPRIPQQTGPGLRQSRPS